MLSKNQVIELTIIDITSEGNGVGKYNDFAVFVPMTAVGDVLKVRIVKVLKSYCFGMTLEILKPSTARIQNDCPVYHRCGGCSFRHMRYDSELTIKNAWVFENMRRIGGIDCQTTEILPSPQETGYRNKAQYPVRKIGDKVEIGFFAKRSHDIVECMNCHLQPAFFEQILEAVKGFIFDEQISVYDEATQKGLVRHIYLRYGEATGEVMVCLVLNGDSLPKQEVLIERLKTSCDKLETVVLNINKKNTNVILGDLCKTIYGKGYITDYLCDVKIAISPLSFYQVNRQSAENLYHTAKDFAALTGEETLIDLYCGTGTIGLSMAGAVKKLIGVEIIPEAIENAKENAKANNIENAEFICDDAGGCAERLLKAGTTPDVVVLDPPRKGCDPMVIEAVARMNPQRIVMISCNSATAARDCKQFAEMGYVVQKVQAVDMFPRTGHVECVALMTRRI